MALTKVILPKSNKERLDDLNGRVLVMETMWRTLTDSLSKLSADLEDDWSK